MNSIRRILFAVQDLDSRQEHGVAERRRIGIVLSPVPASAFAH